MARRMADAGADAALNFWTDADAMHICSAEPTTFAEATTTFSLGSVAPTFDAITDGDVSGRKRRVQAKTGISTPGNGTVNHIALVKTADSSLRYVTVSNAQGVSAGGTADTGVWDIEVADPSA